MAFSDWLTGKDKSFAGLKQEDPGFKLVRETYARYGEWKDVEKAAGWPEGINVAEFVQTIRERIEKHGHLPQLEWHLKKLYGKVKDVMPEHGRLNEMRRLEKRLGDLVKAPRQSP